MPKIHALWTLPVLGKDRLLSPEEAVKAIKDDPYFEDPKMDEELIELAREDRIQVWRRADGELRFRYNPYPKGQKTNLKSGEAETKF